MNWCPPWKAAAKRALSRQLVLVDLLRRQMAAHKALRDAVADVLVHSLMADAMKPPPMGVIPAPGSLWRRLTVLRDVASNLAALDDLSASIVDVGDGKQ